MRRMIAAFVFVGFALHGRAARAQLVPGWISDRTEQWYAAFNAGNAAAMGRLYAPDAVLALQGEVYQGQPAIEAFHRMNFETARFDCTFSIKGTSVVDKVAAV